MNNKIALSFFGAAVLASTPATGHAAELLLNGSFEGPVVVAGQNNLGTVPTNWTVQNSSGTTDAAVSNLTRGVVTNGTGNTGANNLPLDPFDSGSQQSLDISNTGATTQTFTALFNAPATIKIDIGGRDTSSASSATGSYWTLYNNTTNAVVATSSANALRPAFGAWLTYTTSTGVNLFANTSYRFVITLDNPHQVDGLSVIQVPEPTTAAATGLGLGLLGWLGYKRRRRG